MYPNDGGNTVKRLQSHATPGTRPNTWIVFVFRLKDLSNAFSHVSFFSEKGTNLVNLS